MTDAQREALQRLCDRYHVEFRESDYRPRFDLPDTYVAGWIGGPQHGFWEDGNGVMLRSDKTTIYVGVDQDGSVSS